MVFDVVDECFMAMILKDGNEAAAESLIDEAADFQDDMLTRINAAKNKTEFREIRQSLEKAAISFVEKLNALS
jgi:hypothetical protein